MMSEHVSPINVTAMSFTAAEQRGSERGSDTFHLADHCHCHTQYTHHFFNDALLPVDEFKIFIGIAGFQFHSNLLCFPEL